jgi:outer membrane cobalamin receptor
LNGEASHALTPQWRLTARANYQRVRDDDAHTPEPDYPTAIPPYRTRTSTQSLESGISADWQGPFNQKIHGGTSYRRDRMDGRDLLRPAYSIGTAVRPIHAAFLDYTWESGLMPFADRLALHGAARYEYSGHTIAQFSPRAGFSISRGNGTSARLRTDAGRSYRLPDFYDLYFEGYRSRGNPALLPERGWDVDTGIELTHEGPGFWKGTGTWFRNRRKDVIQWRQTFDGTFTPMNVPRADIDGGEFSLSWSTPSRWLIIGGDYLLTRTINRTGERTTDGKWLTNRPRHITNGYVQVQWRSLHVDVRGRIVGKRFVTEANTVALPGYQVLNLTIRERVPLRKSWHTTVGLTCQNLLNERYEILEGAPLPGRDIRLLVQLEF